VDALPAEAAAETGLIREGFARFREALLTCRDRLGFRFLQPGRALNPGPGDVARLRYFPLPAGVSGGLATAMARRHETYLVESREQFFDPFFRRFHRQVVLVDALGALHAGEEAFDDTAEALAAVAASLRGGLGILDLLTGQGVRRVAFAATKADHIPSRSREALHGLLRDLVGKGSGGPLDTTTSVHEVASIRCTEDDVATLEGRPVTVIRGILLETGRSAKVYPGEVPLRRPAGDFWDHAFFEMPVFQPPRLDGDGGAGIPHLGLDALLATLIGDLL
jgi:predicted YcjX-like family ATPase